MNLYELSEEAAQDLIDILLESRERWGEVTARRTQARLEGRFEAIAAGHIPGHRRADVPEEFNLSFVVERPFLIAFEGANRRIVRILYGAQDIPRVFRDRR